MIAGHFGFAAAVKSRETAAPLWALMLATVWLDVVFVPLFLTHVETIKAVSGPPGAYGGGEIFADYTHSLVGAVALSVLFGPWRLGPMGAAQRTGHRRRGLLPLAPGPCRPPR